MKEKQRDVWRWKMLSVNYGTVVATWWYCVGDVSLVAMGRVDLKELVLGLRKTVGQK